MATSCGVSSVISTRGLTKSFGKIEVLRGLDLEVPRGCIHGFLGPNGAGKTTTMHILLGLVPADGGEAEVAGFNARTDAELIRQRSGVLLEHHGLYERLNAPENLALAGGLFGLSRSEALARAKVSLEGIGLWDRRHDRLATWSKGMKQRLAICRALLTGPEIIFLDEPTNGFDPGAAHSLRKDLQELVLQESITVFLNTHNLREAESMCDRVAVLRHGRAVAVGPPKDLGRQHAGLRIRANKIGPKSLAAARDCVGVVSVEATVDGIEVRLRQQSDAPTLIRELAAAGAQIHEVATLGLGLEETYLKLLEVE